MKKQLFLILSGVLLSPCLLALGTNRAYAAATTDDTQAVTTQAELASSSSSDNYTIDGLTITVNATDGSDISTALNLSLREARDLADANPGNIYTVKVPAGSYVQSSMAHIFSNTTLDLTGVTLTCSDQAESFNMIGSGTSGSYKGQDDYNASSICSGYDGFENITILGGTLIGSKNNDSSMVRLFHATNVSIQGLTLKGGGCTHQMEIASINGFYVTDCTFQDNGKSITDTDNTENEEALQLDIPCRDAVYPGIYEDGTPMKNVEITGCTFKNVARGIGTHTLLKGAYHENIKINNNTFDNVVEECIIGLNYYNCEIKNNLITSCGGGILVQNYKSSASSMNTTILNGAKKYTGEFRYDLKTVISGNQISLRYAPTCTTNEGIKVSGYKQEKAAKGGDKSTLPAGDYYISGVTVTNNTIYTSGHGIHFMDARNCTASNNVINGKNVSSSDPTKKKKDGIFVEKYSKNVSITNNTISNMTRNGIMVQISAAVKTISGNTITNCKNRGIQIYDSSKVNGSISGNTIQKIGENGILVSQKSKVTGSINNNKITTTGKYGIHIEKNSTVGKAITANTIKKAKTRGIVISSIKNKLTISKNKISGSSNACIFLEPASTKYKFTVKSNTLTGSKKANGISLRTANATVTKNKISNVAYGVHADAKSKGRIYKNKVSKASKKTVYAASKNVKLK